MYIFQFCTEYSIECQNYPEFGNALLDKALVEGSDHGSRIAAEGLGIIGTARKGKIRIRPVEDPVPEADLALGQEVVYKFIRLDLETQTAKKHDRGYDLAPLGQVFRLIDHFYRDIFIHRPFFPHGQSEAGSPTILAYMDCKRCINLGVN